MSDRIAKGIENTFQGELIRSSRRRAPVSSSLTDNEDEDGEIEVEEDQASIYGDLVEERTYPDKMSKENQRALDRWRDAQIETHRSNRTRIAQNRA